MAEGSGSAGGGQTARDPSSWTPDLLLELVNEIDRRYQQRADAHEAVHIQESRTRKEAAKRIDARLEGLNELRQEVLADRNLFVSREAFDAKLEALATRIEANERTLSRTSGRGEGLGMAASVALGAVTFISVILTIYFAVSSAG